MSMNGNFVIYDRTGHTLARRRTLRRAFLVAKAFAKSYGSIIGVVEAFEDGDEEPWGWVNAEGWLA